MVDGEIMQQRSEAVAAISHVSSATGRCARSWQRLSGRSDTAACVSGKFASEDITPKVARELGDRRGGSGPS